MNMVSFKKLKVVCGGQSTIKQEINERRMLDIHEENLYECFSYSAELLFGFPFIVVVENIVSESSIKPIHNRVECRIHVDSTIVLLGLASVILNKYL